MKHGLTRGELARVLALYGTLGLVTVGGFAASSVMAKSYALLAGLGIVAYVFGLRHGLDADHIAAIDNTTRKLMRDGKRPTTVGMWFSLGHSTVVVALIVALVYATRAVVGAVPGLQVMGDLAGTAVSGIFLWIMGTINAVIVLEIYRIFRAVRTGELDESRFEEALANRGLLNRYFGRVFKVVSQPWQVYPVGVLFGLGFDTASEVALIAISVGVGVTSAVPVWMVLVLPLMFTCGMVLVDTSDALLMTAAYSWAFLKPIRKVYYNLTITIISVVVAFLIGGVELLQVVSREFDMTSGVWASVGRIDFESMGVGVVCIFIVSWAAAFAVYRLKRLEDVRIPVTRAA